MGLILCKASQPVKQSQTTTPGTTALEFLKQEYY